MSNLPRIVRFAILLFVWLAAPTSLQADQRREWPYYVPQATSPPEVASSWGRNDIDRFVYRRLSDAGLEPAAEATRQQLVRRLYFDLIGLPPSPAEVAEFLDDESADAYDALVDRLLKDPRYGERWARLWMDLARYADTAGYEGDPDLPHAWRYRDYLIDAFNNDKPYTEFIKEQIAGDEFAEVMGAADLPSTPPERIVALTFLRLAPFTEPRGDESRHELLSEITSTVSSVFLGLTVGCAKCHDHKHDNIPSEDFYRLKAFFSTISIPRPEPGDGFQIGGSIAAAFYRPGEQKWSTAMKDKVRREADGAQEELAALTVKLKKQLGGQAGFGLQAMGGSLGNNYIFGRTPVHDGKLQMSIVNCDGEQWVFSTNGQAESRTGSNAGSNQGQWFADLPDPQHVTLGQYSEGTGAIKVAGAHHVGEVAQVLIYDHPLSAAEQRGLAAWLAAESDPVANQVDRPIEPPQSGLQFWLDASDLDADPATANPPPGSHVSSWVDRVSGITLAQKDSDRQPVVKVIKPADAASSMTGVSFADDFLSGKLGGAAFAGNQTGALVVIYTARHAHEGYGFEVGGGGDFLSTFINPGAAEREDLASVISDPTNPLVSQEDRRRFQWLSTRESFVSQTLKRLRPVAMSLRHSYGPPYEPGVPTTRVMIRGEYDNPGEVVQAGFPSCITGNQDPAKIRLDPFKRWPTRSRRMALAKWIASPQNPLTARVMVNRLWYWHFGRGIVATPSDFGKLSGGPTHRELLDWLALRFVQEKWSLKAMHRLIVQSATYRQTSLRLDPRAHEVDPNNQLLWRFRRRRLEAEAVRDSVLSASGRLNPEQFGLPIFPPLPDDIEQRVKYSNSKWDTQHGPEGRKRSIYIYQQRTLTMPLMQSFDGLVCDESRPRRRASVTPLQALAMYNGKFVSEEARQFADRVRREAGDDAERQIELAFQIALSRPAAVAERKALSALDGPGHGRLEAICRILLNSSEFMYVD